MHIANFREDSFRFIQWMPELAQHDEIIGRRKIAHPIQLHFHNSLSIRMGKDRELEDCW